MRSAVLAALAVLAAGVSLPSSAQSGRPVYRCPGDPVLYTDAISPKEARDRGCRTIEGAPVTVISMPRPRASAPAAASAAPGAASPPAPTTRVPAQRVDPAEQRARDSDARRILLAELQRDELRLAELLHEYNNGQPERLGSERNYQKYLDRVEDLKSAINRKQADIAAIRRELAKLPQ